MRRLFCILVLTAFTSLIFGQSVNEVYLKNGSIIKGNIVEMDPLNGVKIEANDGSIFVYSMSEIDHVSRSEEKNIRNKSVIGNNSPERKIERKGSNFIWIDNEEYLNSVEYHSILNDNLYKTFTSAHKQFITGNILIYSGLGLVPISGGIWLGALLSGYGEAPLYVISGILGGLSQASLVMGFVFKGIGKGRLEWVKNNYNSGRSFSSTINFSPTLLMTAQNDLGFGVSLNLSF